MKLKTYSIIIASTILILLSGAVPVFAQDLGAQELIKEVNREQKRTSISVEKKQDELARIKKRADTEIDRRINSLNKLLARIQSDNKLSADEKSNISADINSNIAGLTSLKAKIDADTDAATAKSDAKQIFINFRIFANFEPKTRLLISIDNLQVVANRISSFTPKIQDLINNLKSQGKDVASLQASLDDINKTLITINGQLSIDKATVLGVSVSTTDPKTIFTNVRQDLSKVRSEFAQIRNDIAQMRNAFRIIIQGGNSANTTTPAVSPK